MKNNEDVERFDEPPAWRTKNEEDNQTRTCAWLRFRPPTGVCPRPARARDLFGQRARRSRKPARTVEILLNEMDYAPARIEVKRGEAVSFSCCANVGKEDHEFLLATTKENLAHAVEMKKASAHGRRPQRRPGSHRNKTAEISLEVQQGRHVRILTHDSPDRDLRHGRPTSP